MRFFSSCTAQRRRFLMPMVVLTTLAFTLCADVNSSPTRAAAGALRKRNGMRPGSARGRYDRRNRGLVVGGTPTGGGKFPFLVIVDWFDSWNQPGNSDPRFLSYDIICHGVMVAVDVVLTWSNCWPNNGYVVVGDSPTNSSYQYRNARVVYHHPLNTALSSILHKIKIEPVTFQGFYPARLAKSLDVPYIGQNITMAGYGYPASYGGARELSVPVKDVRAGLYFKAGGDDDFRGDDIRGDDYFGMDDFYIGADEIGPCTGDYGIPAVDQSKSLVGIADWPEYSGIDSCAIKPSSFYPVSHVADAIERILCPFSDRPETLSFCGPLVCPMYEVLLGYPWALLPNRTGSVKGLRGFSPVSISQWPPPGTPLWRSTTTNATMTAIDASGRKLECGWQVRVPALVELGSATVNIRNGTYNETIRFIGYEKRPGLVFKLTGRASNKVRGRGSSIGAVIRDPSNKQTGRSLTIKESEDRGAVRIPKVKVQFSASNISDIKLDVYVSRNDQPNQLTFFAYGQPNNIFFYL